MSRRHVFPRVIRRGYRPAGYVEECRADGWHWIRPESGRPWRLMSCKDRLCPAADSERRACTVIRL